MMPCQEQFLIVYSDLAFSKRAYNTLVTIFVNRIHGAEIEILPPALSPTDGSLYIDDGPSLGIPKTVLKAAFLEAIETFNRNRTTGDPNPLLTLEATAIILLFDPEHLTAANYRKRSILSAAANKHDPNMHGIMNAVYKELVFLSTILSSPLHRQTKSPTLWHHRWWLFSKVVPRVAMTGIQGIAGGGMHLVQSELVTILKAAERHPSNYYAWQYARRLFTSRYMDVALQYDFQRLSWAVLSDDMASWCLKHPSDTSGWSFLLWMLLDGRSDEHTGSRVVSRVLEFVEQVDWKSEALWHFLRTAVLMPNMAHQSAVRGRFMQKHAHWKSPTSRMSGISVQP